jgi:glycine dehydrogenase subunit 1
LIFEGVITANEKPFVHPYMANSVPEIKEEMLKQIGVKNVEELYEQIPDSLRLRRKLSLPEPILAESALKRHVTDILTKNKTCEENLSFLGGGCWQHYVPAVCDEICERSEFLTAMWGSPSSDHGRNQAWFEFCSQIGELVNLDVVGLPCYSWGCAAGFAIRMASRITDRKEVLLPKTISPERLAVIRNYCEPPGMPNHVDIKFVNHLNTGLLDVEDLKRKISSKTAAAYIENPSYLGFIESQGAEISEIAHANGAESIVGVDAISLGVLAAPSDYGADIVVGTTQPLGLHMNCGGGESGFIATRDEVKYVGEFPTLLVSIAETSEKGEHGFGLSSEHQTSYGLRDKAKDWTGCTVYLWTIVNAVYMALMGPQGFGEIGELIIQKSHYAAKLLSEINGVKIPFTSNFFKEFVVNFDGTGKTVAEANRALLKHNIFGGKDISKEFPELGNSALYCVTEVHSQGDIEKLASALRGVLA